jgi:hypothetical protein
LSAPDSAISEFATSQVDQVRIYMESRQFSVEPGGQTSVSFRLHNRSAKAVYFEVSVTGIPAKWMVFPRSELQFWPDQQQEVSFTIQPPRSPQSKAGDYPFTVRASGYDDEAVVKGILIVAPYHQFSLDELRPQKQRGTKKGIFRIRAVNQGNADLALEFEAVDDEEGCDYSFDPAPVTLTPGEERLVGLQVKPKEPLRGNTVKTFPFTVTCRPPEVPKLASQVRGEFVQVPLKPRWLWLVVALLLLLSVPIGMLFFYSVFYRLLGVNYDSSLLAGTACGGAMWLVAIVIAIRLVRWPE